MTPTAKPRATATQRPRETNVAPPDTVVVLASSADDTPTHTVLRRVLIASSISVLAHALSLVALGLWGFETPLFKFHNDLVVQFIAPRPVLVASIETLTELSSGESFAPAPLMPVAIQSAIDAQIDTPQMTAHGLQLARHEIKITAPLDLEMQGRKNGGTGGNGIGGTGNGASDAGQEGLGELSELAKLRSPEGRKAAAMKRGATPESETAVEMALRWFVNHQQADGSWSLDHRTRYCGLECDCHGTMPQAHVAATSLALLPFLGAGYTHRSGKYQKEVARGLTYLERFVSKEGNAVQVYGGGMYAHGLATITLCEAYGMTGDRALQRQAQRAVQFISYAQDPIGGGWRYMPGQPGDTSIVGWQLMALKSASISKLKVQQQTIDRAIRFLNSVQFHGGPHYGYLPSHTEARDSMTAVALLCRMLLGWQRDNATLAEGVQHLSVLGPSLSDYYYNYYATQVMHNFEGPTWQQWNQKMRDQLVRTQSRKGHSAGSWYIDGGDDDHNELGGRHYCTAMAAMTLEVYYRYLPIYRSGKAEE